MQNMNEDKSCDFLLLWSQEKLYEICNKLEWQHTDP